ncbi:hypothetical protein ACFV30_16520 [Streptomyces sp. NPDC059752]|uniref:hypothetical protein n=1 Tax=unclassified Streptomyces TaxID=2593676 RepID=UPI003646790E
MRDDVKTASTLPDSFEQKTCGVQLPAEILALESIESIFVEAVICEGHEMPMSEPCENRLVVRIACPVQTDVNISLELRELLLSWFQDSGQDEKAAKLVNRGRLLQSIESLV